MMLEHTITLERVPSTLDDFLALRDVHARTPRGAAAMFALALVLYSQDRALGSLCVLVSTRNDLLDDDPQGYKGKRLRRARALDLESRVGSKPHIARSYVQGTAHSAGYVLPPPPWTIRVREQKNSVESETRAKMFVWSTGADSPRPIALERNDKGLWKAYEWSSLEVDVRPPARASDEL